MPERNGHIMAGYIALGVVLAVLIALFSRFRPAATQMILSNLYAIRCIFVNFYALRTNSGVVLFDTGMNPAAAVRGLKKVGIEPDDVTHVFLTHTDYDHAGGISAFKKAEWFISSEEEQMINGTTARRGFIRNRHFSPYSKINDGETVVVDGINIKAHITPGHTPGSTVYCIDNRLCMCGDLLRISRKGDFLPFLWLMNMNHHQDKESLVAMQPIIKGYEYVLSGHTGVYRNHHGV